MTAVPSRADFDKYPWQEVLANAAKREAFSYRMEFGKQWQKAKEDSDAVGEPVYATLIMVTDVQLDPDDPDEPFGPRFVRQAARGVTPGDLTDEQYAILRELAPTITDPEMRARVCDLVWTVKRGNPDIARMAVSAYLESAIALEDPEHWVVCEERMRRAIRLARSLGGGGTAEFRQAIAHVEAVLAKYDGEDPSFLSCRLMELLQQVKQGEPAKYAALAAKAAARAESNSEFRRARHYWECAAEWHSIAKDTAQKDAALVAAAETYVKEAEEAAKGPPERSPNIHASGSLQRAIQALRRVGSPPAVERANALYLRLVDHQKKSVAELITAQHKVDLTDLHRIAENAVSGRSIDDALVSIASLVKPAAKAELRSRVEKMNSANPLMFFMGMTKLTNTGKIMAERPGFESSEEARERATVAEMYSQAKHNRWFIAQGYLVPAILKVREEHAVRMEDFYRIAASSMFVPQGRELTFAKGLYAGFRGDLIVSTHLLIPQIEESIRGFLSARGVITSGFNRQNLQNEHDLNTMLIKDEMKLLFDEDTVFDLRGLLIEHHGENLRNFMAHGMLNDLELDSAAALYLWGLTLRVCLTMIVPPGSED
jgi:hypothetical protein